MKANEYSQGLAIKLSDGSIISAKGDTSEEVEQRLKEMTLLHAKLKVEPVSTGHSTAPQEPSKKPFDENSEHFCHIPEHKNAPLKLGTSKTKVNQLGEPKKYWYHIDASDKMCFGQLPSKSGSAGYREDMGY